MCQNITFKNKGMSQPYTKTQTRNEPEADQMVSSAGKTETSGKNCSSKTNLRPNFSHKLSVKNCNKMKDT